MKLANGIKFTCDTKDCNIYIVTPIDKNKRPLIKAIGKDDIVIYESTVYPGATST